MGIITRKYKADDQPWILKSYGSGVKKFKGMDCFSCYILHNITLVV